MEVGKRMIYVTQGRQIVGCTHLIGENGVGCLHQIGYVVPWLGHLSFNGINWCLSDYLGTVLYVFTTPTIIIADAAKTADTAAAGIPIVKIEFSIDNYRMYISFSVLFTSKDLDCAPFLDVIKAVAMGF